ncbi:carotenoid oxygenase [Pyrenochaeta sp. MPI-SDFR-AT-0127]|nr:carotenoid oxygenase [Pyrenochaeta sp. MPI-SDFR-AT-0127]
MAAYAPAYIDGIRATSRTEFPNTPVFNNWIAPSRFEGDLQFLEVKGTVPTSIRGIYYSMGVDQRFPPKYESDILFNGDGIISAFRIEDGQIDWKRRYVHTDRYKAESKARRPLFGKYRNPFTDDEEVQGIIRTAANTNTTFWRGALLAMKEDGPPFAVHPETLETFGRYDFEGQVQSPTFTAHPKIDPRTGSMLCFSYEAGGNGNDASKEMVFYEINKDGKKITEVWFEAPFCGYSHDFGFTTNYAILPVSPLKSDLNRLKQGGNHWAWDPKEDHLFAIVPRKNPLSKDVRWVRSDNAFQGHIANAFEDEAGKLHYDLSMADDNVFWWFPEEGKEPLHPGKRGRAIRSPMTRFIFDTASLSKDSRVEPTYKCETSTEFARIDDRFQGRRYNHFWALGMDLTRSYDFEACGPPASGLFNLLVHWNWETKQEEVWWPGPRTTLQEPCFVPRSEDAPEGDGYIVVVLNRLDLKYIELAFFDAQHIMDGPIGLSKLPLRPRIAFHGNFVGLAEIEEFARLREDQLGPVKPAQKPLPWQIQKQGEHHSC